MHPARVSDRLLVITGDYLDEHMTVVATGDGLVVIDTLATLPATRAALPAIAAFSREPVRFVINTHCDADHTAGNQLFTGATIVGHRHAPRHDQERVFDDPQSVADIQQFIQQLETNPDHARPAARHRCYLDAYRTLLDGFVGFRHTPPVVLAAGGTGLALGDIRIELEDAAPAHTDADLLVRVPALDLLVAGDTVLGAGFVPVAHAIHGGSVTGMRAVLERLAASLPPATRIIPGHGAPGGLELIARQQDYLDALLDAVGQARAQGRTLEEIRDSLQLEPFRDHFMYDLVHAIHVEMAWRETAPGD
ncbi:MAG TPA: MBL fold metallo-hydrolase [Acidobacteriota bacterium]|nr:MBL fold metallo-hydrolase [Acidobacteriota bacterium]HQM63553.1 MBL fold metallo-hydrolase [Acidobacteriota bacterium]